MVMALGHGFMDANAYGELVTKCCINGTQCDQYGTEECATNLPTYPVNDPLNVFDDCTNDDYDDDYYARFRGVLKTKYSNVKSRRDNGSMRLLSSPS